MTKREILQILGELVRAVEEDESIIGNVSEQLFRAP